jgi:glucose-fructose oxidoreductase
VVGLGWIAQESVLPGFRNAARNSELAALVTGNAGKARILSEEYDVATTISYDKYDELLRSGSIDAVYVALPNNLHADFTIRAARAGVHVLCEKPMASTVEQCQSMTSACEEHGVRLMIAYRLHFEERCSGVKDVRNEIRVGRDSESSTAEKGKSHTTGTAKSV